MDNNEFNNKIKLNVEQNKVNDKEKQLNRRQKLIILILLFFIVLMISLIYWKINYDLKKISSENITDIKNDKIDDENKNNNQDSNDENITVPNQDITL